MGPRWRLVLAALWGIVVAPPGLAEVALENDVKSPVNLPGATPCWQTGDFVVTVQCAPCTSFQTKRLPVCGTTGFVEQINCSASKKDEFKSCRSTVMEARLFWKFEGAMLGVAAVFALLVECLKGNSWGGRPAAIPPRATKNRQSKMTTAPKRERSMAAGSGGQNLTETFFLT